MSNNNDLVFKKDDSGNLVFVGNFEKLYQTEENPWDQTSNSGDRGKYYEWSRNRLIKKLKNCKSKIILEVGSGLGTQTSFISNELENSVCDGLEISITAVKKAIIRYPNLNFYQADISSNNFALNKSYDTVILSHLLWYVSYEFPKVLDNCNLLLNKQGIIIISQAFLKTKQNYAKDIMNGFLGTTNYLRSILPNNLEIIDEDFGNDKKYIHDDGIIIIKKF